MTDVAAANGARVESVRIESAGGVPKAVDVTVSERVTGNVPGVGRRVDRVLSWSRAGVTYSATLAQTRFGRSISVARAARRRWWRPPRPRSGGRTCGAGRVARRAGSTAPG